MRRLHAMSTRWLVLICAALLGFTGCESTDEGVIDLSGTPAFISVARLDPDTIRLQAIPPVGDTYPATVDVEATVMDPVGNAGDITVFAQLFKPESSAQWQQIQLRDDGTDPDATAGDSVFSGRFAFDLISSDAGAFRVSVRSVSETGYRSNVLENTLFVMRLNASPALSNLSAPDTLDLPGTGSVLFPMSVNATDPDGPEDIQEVYFRNLDSPSDPNRKTFLFDDGNTGVSGDSVAGDGVYTRVLQLPSTTPKQTYRFAFQAADTFGDTSATLLHSLTVR
jgi:hypothetical protein